MITYKVKPEHLANALAALKLLSMTHILHPLSRHGETLDFGITWENNFLGEIKKVSDLDGTEAAILGHYGHF